MRRRQKINEQQRFPSAIKIFGQSSYFLAFVFPLEKQWRSCGTHLLEEKKSMPTSLIPKLSINTFALNFLDAMAFTTYPLAVHIHPNQILDFFPQTQLLLQATKGIVSWLDCCWPRTKRWVSDRTGFTTYTNQLSVLGTSQICSASQIGCWPQSSYTYFFSQVLIFDFALNLNFYSI